MNTTNRTLMFLAVATFAVLSAVGVKYINRPVANADFADVGEVFFPDFLDPLNATSLSVAKYDLESKEPLSFSVKQNDKGLWVIPSHHDYPAEAKDRLARTATSFIGAKKMALQSRNKDDWGRYGVADPEDDVAIDPDAKDGEKDESRGTHVTLRDSGGNALVDLIIGKQVEGRSQNYYVRQPEKNNVYIAEIAADLSAKFSDWIEPDLLKLNQNDIVQVVVDKYSIDEDKGEILHDETLEFDKDSNSGKWAVAGLEAETESVKEAPINDLAKNLDQLKIVGVRPKPEGLNADLTVSGEVANNPVVMQILQADMQRQGFFIARGENGKKKLVSNEGELVAGTKNGVRYTLYFGEVARGSARDIETGLNEAPAKEEDAAKDSAESDEKSDAAEAGEKPPESEESPDDEKSGPRRYLLVKVEFDESLMGEKPTEPVPPEKPAILNDETPSFDTPGEPEAEGSTPDGPPGESEPAEDATPKEEASSPATEEKALDDTEEKKQDAADEASSDPPACDEPAPDQSETAESGPADTGSTDESAPQTDELKTAPTGPVTGDESPEIVPATPDTTTPEPGGEEKADALPTTQEEAAPAVDPKAEAQKQYLQALGNYEAQKSGFADALKSWEERSAEGTKLAQELSTRFGAWYYVISAESFEKLRPTRAEVVGPKEEAPQPGGTGLPPQFDGLPGGIPGHGK